MFLSCPDVSKGRRTFTCPSVDTITFRIGLLIVLCHPSLMTQKLISLYMGVRICMVSCCSRASVAGRFFCVHVFLLDKEGKVVLPVQPKKESWSCCDLLPLEAMCTVMVSKQSCKQGNHPILRGDHRTIPKKKFTKIMIFLGFSSIFPRLLW